MGKDRSLYNAQIGQGVTSELQERGVSDYSNLPFKKPGNNNSVYFLSLQNK